MLADFYKAVTGYFGELGQYLSQQWHHMTPNRYIILLIFVGVCGWILMRNQGR